MGICQSCLGRWRDLDAYDEGEETCLLYDDGHGMQYGCFSDDSICGEETEAQCEHDALQRVIDKTTSEMVDVFEIAPPPDDGGHIGISIPCAIPGQMGRTSRYQHLVSKFNDRVGNCAHKITIDVRTERDNKLEMRSNRSARSRTLGKKNRAALVGTFVDAAAAMK
ncbi:hypothetical protein E4U41_002322 [Claviceps citrina]|nr:hypothetical protein E4U41_002322 [Claviceps citrina]